MLIGKEVGKVFALSAGLSLVEPGPMGSSKSMLGDAFSPRG